MKKTLLFLVIMGLLLSASGLFAQNLLDNAEYRKGLQYQGIAKQAYQDGDYDKSIEYSAMAQEQFKIAREYAEMMRLRYMAYNLKNRATDRLKYADYINAAKNYPLEYTGARAAFASAETAFDGENYTAGIEGYRKTLDLLKDIKAATPIPAEELARAESLKATIEKFNLAPGRPGEYKRGNDAYVAGKALVDKDNAKARELLTEAVKNYQIVLDAGIAELAKARRAEIAAAKKQADSVEAMKNAAAKYAEAQRFQNSAEMQLSMKSYENAWTSSGDAIAAYKESYGLAMKNLTPTLPEFYTVRLLPDRRDCFWRIAEYDFIYNDPWSWKLIYEANKNLIPDPNDPDLILPGTRLRIPSKAGEKRSGDWAPK
jgi:nucleoid-associated protein YgaU